MKDRAISFSKPMPERIINGTKTETRRVAGFKENEIVRLATSQEWTETIARKEVLKGIVGQPNHRDEDNDLHPFVLADGTISDVRCPFGGKGDRLWGREVHYRYGHWEVDPAKTTKTGKQKWKFVPDSTEILYAAPIDCISPTYHREPNRSGWRKRLARFMPRSASRIQLVMVSVHLERLQSITPESAAAEGLIKLPASGRFCLYPGDQYFGNATSNPIEAFSWLWDSLHGAGSWQSNPWVWVIRFRNVDDALNSMISKDQGTEIYGV